MRFNGVFQRHASHKANKKKKGFYSVSRRENVSTREQNHLEVFILLYFSTTQYRVYVHVWDRKIMGFSSWSGFPKRNAGHRRTCPMTITTPPCRCIGIFIICFPVLEETFCNRREINIDFGNIRRYILVGCIFCQL